MRNSALFLDRDGVINVEISDGYVTKWQEWEYLPGALNALALFSKLFHHIFIVTNQRGVGRGIMTLDSLHDIHNQLKKDVAQVGGRIDAIYFCTDVDSESPRRKPNIGMGLDAQSDFPHFVFDESVMVGNSRGDLEFGRNLGMSTVFIRDDLYQASPDLYDAKFPRLIDFANAVNKANGFQQWIQQAKYSE